MIIILMEYVITIKEEKYDGNRTLIQSFSVLVNDVFHQNVHIC